MNNKDANRLMGTAALMVPKSSQDTLQSAAPLIVGAACVQAEIHVDIIMVAGSAPSRKNINRIIEGLSVDTMMKINAMLKRNPHIYLMCDKANSDKKVRSLQPF